MQDRAQDKYEIMLEVKSRNELLIAGVRVDLFKINRFLTPSLDKGMTYYYKASLNGKPLVINDLTRGGRVLLSACIR